MSVRFLAVIRNAPTSSQSDPALLFAKLPSISGFRCVYDDGMTTVATDQRAPLLVGRRGIVLGSLFERGGRAAVSRMEAEQQRSILATRGDHLIERFWGPYVAILSDRETRRVDIVRAPLGEVPCYYILVGGTVVMASDVELLIAAGVLTPAVNWTQVIRQLLFRDLLGSETCLTGLSELRGGERLCLGQGGCDTKVLWSPWHFTEIRASIQNPNEAASRVLEMTLECLEARASTFGRTLVMLSGGLDSSIVAASLAARQRPFHCLTLATAEPTGDERDYARLVCSALSADLTESFREISLIDVAESAARGLPRPSARSFAQESRRLAVLTASEVGAQAIFNGGGGDNVFCSLQSASPAADRLRVSGLGMGFFSTVHDISKLAPASLWEVASDAAKRAWLGKPAFRIVADTSLLAGEAQSLAATTEIHPWLKVPRGALPGKAMHVRLLAYAQSLVESSDPQTTLPSISPLLSQPLVEACLAVPSWLWFDGGRNRVIARQAFSDYLPDRILERRSKGTPDSFVARIFETYRAKLREILADGELATHGVIDVPAVLRILDDPRPAYGDAFRRVLQFADVEAWAQSWMPSR